MAEATFEHLRAVPQEGILVITPIHSELRGDELMEAVGKELRAAIDQHPTDKVVLDLRFVHYASSRGLGTFAGFHREFVRGRGGRIALCGLKPIVEDAMHQVRFIAGGSSAPLAAGPAPEASGTSKPEHKPLFDIVTPDVASAVATLSGEAK
jgi:anti-anti-sigma factor